MPLTGPLPEPVRRRLRILAWRARRPLAALCAGLAAVVAVGLVRPADPPTARVPVAARDLALGAVVAAGDVTVAEVPVAMLPAAVLDAAPDAVADDLVGRRLAVPVPAGLPLVGELLVDEAGTGPPGTVVVPVRFADAGVADVLRPGMRVDVVAAALHDGDDALRLAEAAIVLAQQGGTDEASGSGGGLLGGGASTAESAPVLLAVAPDESVALSGAASARALSAVIVG